MRTRVLVTGAAGFLGGHLVDTLLKDGEDVVAWERTNINSRARRQACAWQQVDICDPHAVSRALEYVRPAQIFHLAAHAGTSDGWGRLSYIDQVNVQGTRYLLSSVRALGIDCRVLIPGSALVYARSSTPIGESVAVEPRNAYAVTKLLQEQVARECASERLTVLLARSFNHIGPGQRGGMMLPDWALQIAKAEAAGAPAKISVKSLNAVRDLIDARDAVLAYRAVMDRGIGDTVASPSVYNICGGPDRTYDLGDLFNRVRGIARVSVTAVEPEDRGSRTALVGDPSRIRTEFGWAPRIDIQDTLVDTLNYFRNESAD